MEQSSPVKCCQVGNSDTVDIMEQSRAACACNLVKLTIWKQWIYGAKQLEQPCAICNYSNLFI